jgi:hypothetical protein
VPAVLMSRIVVQSVYYRWKTPHQSPVRVIQIPFLQETPHPLARRPVLFHRATEYFECPGGHSVNERSRYRCPDISPVLACRAGKVKIRERQDL